MTKRLFIAVDIKSQPALAGFFGNLKKQLRDEAIKWVDKNIFHLTLKFIGDTDEAKISSIKEALTEVCHGFDAFSFKVAGLDYFGSRHEPRVLFSEIEDGQPLKDLANLIDEKLSCLGFEKEQKTFKAHLTLGRIKHIANKTAFFSLLKNETGKFLQEVKAEEVVLYESILKQEGPEYIPLFKFRFRD